ncbi:uncharacterized protein Z520_01832 [Fonsecaea multimorphosa CBS 102226]|uniref:NACHT domain-containing protein n=1 Tax=Fonsecaea multimorphosa CBS 102226 TaxID=1442371 RepID=A0A0D2KXX5_9EURO|nr:uncharacterized protein Z520_01832 [Fonsecaea multimorphosa CBS 102226]KIY01694.1 hypothetical protein Z520_01832 [Fonsecaea multimorphosa CBS 102226]OAL29889.1 hypothetical protein AYO22_01795 [Fonsecaea multimorphosa]
MTDPFSIVTGFAGLISLGIQVTESLVEFYAAYKDQDANVARTTARIESLLTLFRSLDAALKKRTFQPDEQDLIKNIESSVHTCEDIIREMQDECAKLSKTSATDFKGALKVAGRRVAYPFRQSTLQKLDEDVGEIRDNLSLALDVLQLRNQKKAQDDIAELKLLLTLVNSAQISSSVREWLKAPDASVNHNAACAKRHPGTGMWFINGPEFTTWLKQDGSFLWLKGPAGCGKSVLCATAIQHTFRQKNSVVNAGIAFFYFTFSESSKQDESAMLRALLLQLSGQLPNGQDILSRLQTSSQAGTPSTPLLIEHLRDVAQRFQHVYILLDALDESPRYGKLDQVLNALETMRNWSLPGLHLLVTSRDEPEIRDSLNPAHEQTLIMQNAGIDQDINDFITSQLDVDPKLRWCHLHHGRIKNELAGRAQGVFRWVECQFESLRRCLRSERHLDRCLASLPRGLDETYERMLSNIDEDSIEEARRILTLLCFTTRPLTVPELLDGVAVDLNEPAGLNRGRRLHGEDDIRNICPGLVDIRFEGTLTGKYPNETRVVRPVVRLAHFSVQEYLESGRITEKRAATFALQSAPAHAEIAQICLVYLLEPELFSGPSDESVDSKLPLCHFASRYWVDHYRAAGFVASRLDELTLRLFRRPDSLRAWFKWYNETMPLYYRAEDVESYYFSIALPVFCASFLGLDEVLSKILALEDSDSERRNLINTVFGPGPTSPLAAAARGGHDKVVCMLLSAGADVSVGDYEALSEASSKGYKNMVITLLHADPCKGGLHRALVAACFYGRTDVVKLLLDAGADANGRNHSREALLQIAAMKGSRDIVEILLSAGADVNTAVHGYTALQRAAEYGDTEMVKMLLSAGADVNAVVFGYGALHYAIKNGDTEVMKVLLSAGADINARRQSYGTALDHALMAGKWDIVEILLDAGAIDDEGKGRRALGDGSRVSRARFC